VQNAVAYLAAHSYDFSVGNLIRKRKTNHFSVWNGIIITIIIILTRCSQTEDYKE